MDNFTPTVNSDNRFHPICEDKTDSIIIGGSCTHLFKLPFVFSDYAKSARVIYKQGIEVILDLPVTATMIHENDWVTLIEVDLKPSQTLLFKDCVLDTQAQVKIITKTDEVMYDTPWCINVIAPLKVDHAVGGE